MRRRRIPRLLLPLVLLLAFVSTTCSQPPGSETGRWVGTWASAPQIPEPHNVPPPPGIEGSTLRQVVRVSIGGARVRVRLSNAFGREPLTITAAHLAVSDGADRIRPETGRALTFSGRASVTIPAGAPMLSDPLDMPLDPLSSVAITIHVSQTPEDVTSHPGARCTSYLQEGDHVAAQELPEAVQVDRWYILNGIDVFTDNSLGAVAVLGDSITDGRGSTTNQNRRWPDFLAERLLQRNPEIGVLNLGVGGNRVLQDGLGPNALARLDRDVFAQSRVRWLIVLEGINDIGTAELEDPAEVSDLVDQLTAAYEQITERAHSQDIRVFGATLLPFEGSFYFTPQREAARQAVNEWIRTSGRFDGFIDFDRATRDPAAPGYLRSGLDSGDHLHPSDLGYRTMAESIEMDRLFR